MIVTEEKLNAIYDRTSGYCHICGKKLCFINYARLGRRGAWEVDHSVARVNGGTNRLCNLYAACISCNRQKQHLLTRTARRWHGRTRAPLSAKRRQRARLDISGTPIGNRGWLGYCSKSVPNRLCAS
jgi:5-methylcytosine-specific restriction endonuclease McrA